MIAPVSRSHDVRSRPSAPNAGRVPLRSVALPNEHGAWGFWLEPVLLGLLVLPSAAGALVATAGLFGVLTQHPLSLVLADRARGRTYPRTGLALRVLVMYGALAAVTFGLALVLAGPVLLAPLALALPLALVQLRFDRANRGRELAPELCGSAAIAALAPMIALAAGAPLAVAALLYLAVLGRNLPTVLYVRARLRLERGTGDPRGSGGTRALLASGGALAASAALASFAFLPVLAVAAYALLFARTAYGLSPLRRPSSGRAIGMREIAYGVATVLLLAFGWPVG